MPYPAILSADDELALIQYLRLRPAVTALVPAARITTALPPDPVYPAVVLHSLGGAGMDRWIDTPSIQVDVLGPQNRQTCKVLALTVRAAILAIANDTVPAGVLVSASEDITPQWLPDAQQSNPPLPRFTSRYRLVIHP